MKNQIGSPEILKKSHAHKSKKDYSRKDKWFDEHVEVIGMDKKKLKKKIENVKEDVVPLTELDAFFR